MASEQGRRRKPAAKKKAAQTKRRKRAVAAHQKQTNRPQASNGARTTISAVRKAYEKTKEKVEALAAFVGRILGRFGSKIRSGATRLRTPTGYRDPTHVGSWYTRLTNLALFGLSVWLAYVVTALLMPAWLAAFAVATIVVHEFGHFVAARRNRWWSWWPIIIPFGIAILGLTHVPGIEEMSGSTASEVAMAGPAYGLVFVGAIAAAALWLRLAPLAWAAAWFGGAQVWSATIGSDGRKYRYHRARSSTIEAKVVSGATDETEWPVGEKRSLTGAIQGLEGVEATNQGGGVFELVDITPAQKSNVKSAIVSGDLHVYVTDESENSMILREYAARPEEVNLE